MAKKKLDNKIALIKAEFENILVCNDRQMSPFLEILTQAPENIDNQSLGTLIGVFEVTDTSKDSSYIVNYLISVIKKEYFSKSKRAPIESLESALHKANLALSKLAEHGNIGWLGKLNVLVAVIEKNNLHLSQAGTASALLLRSKTITDVSDGLAPEKSELHPLKTFMSVSSGRLEINDKLIIATDSIFDIFSLEEIKKSSLRFSDKKFVQFLRTALGSELEKAAVLVVELNAQKEALKIEPKKQPEELNVFSNNAFSKTKKTANDRAKEFDREIQKEIQYEKTGFVDEKTGHIYIKEGVGTAMQEENNTNYTQKNANKSIDKLLGIATTTKDLSIGLVKNIHFPNFEKIKSKTRKIQPDYQSLIETVRAQTSARAKVATSLSTILLAKIVELTKLIFSAKNRAIAISLFQSIYRKFIFLLCLILPSLAKIKNNLHKMNSKQKLYATLTILSIIIVPLFIIKLQNNLASKKAVELATTNQPAPLALEQDKNIVRIETLNSIYSGKDILKIINLNGAMFAITNAEIIDLEKNKSTSIPSEFTSPVQITTMNDLNLVFLLTASNKIASFSPISSEFKDNQITIPTDATVKAIGSYLTYIYLLDSKNNQIYRYPRAEGGFGEKTSWLKDSFAFADTVDLSINENIFIANQKNIAKLFRGKIQETSAIEETATPIKITKIATGEQSGAIFILDAQNARVIQLDAEKKIVAQYYNPEIASATSLAVNESTKTIFISSQDSVKTISIN
jgi:hypothetical protein